MSATNVSGVDSRGREREAEREEKKGRNLAACFGYFLHIQVTRVGMKGGETRVGSQVARV